MAWLKLVAILGVRRLFKLFLSPLAKAVIIVSYAISAPRIKFSFSSASNSFEFFFFNFTSCCLLNSSNFFSENPG